MLSVAPVYGVFMETKISVKRLMVSMSPFAVTHTISANGSVMAPTTRFNLSLLISPNESRMPLSIRGLVDVSMADVL